MTAEWSKISIYTAVALLFLENEVLTLEALHFGRTVGEDAIATLAMTALKHKVMRRHNEVNNNRFEAID